MDFEILLRSSGLKIDARPLQIRDLTGVETERGRAGLRVENVSQAGPILAVKEKTRQLLSGVSKHTGSKAMDT